MDYILPPLPYALDALQPAISRETLEYHHGKHHQAYVDKLNKLVKESDYRDASLEHIIKEASGEIFNNAAQVWNHTFYWNCMKPNGGGKPDGALAKAITARWGSFDQFKSEFSKSCVGNFGSGWTWLVKRTDGSLDIRNTSNAATPLTSGETPLLACDDWEHAYYIDYRNQREKYVEGFFTVVNWDFVAKNFG